MRTRVYRLSASRIAPQHSLLTLGLLLPVLLLAAVLRLDGLSQRGLLYWDEAKFALEGIRLLSLLQALPHAHPALMAGKAIGTAKPTHALLIAASYAIFGVHDYAPLLMNSVASLAEIGVLFLLAQRLFDLRVALIAAALLAVSGYDIIYARSALSESDGNLILLSAVLVWYSTTGWNKALGKRWRRLGPGSFLTGVLLGLAFTTNYRLSVYVATVLALSLGVTWHEDGWKSALRATFLMLAGCVVVPLAWQLAGAFAGAHGLVLFRSEINYRPSSYLSEVLYQLHGGKQSAVRFGPVPYLQWYEIRQGWPVLGLLVSGLFLAARRRSLAWFLPAVMVLAPYALYTFAPFIVPRNLDAILPFAMLLSAAALSEIVVWLSREAPATVPLAVGRLSRLAGRRSLLMGAVTVVLVLAGILRDWPLTGVRSGFAQAAVYVTQHRSQQAIAVNEIMRFYLRDPGRGCDAPRLPPELSALAALTRNGAAYAVIDQYTKPLARYLAHHARVVASFPATGVTPFGEDLIASENGVPPGRIRMESVRVYSLQNIRARSTRRSPGGVCTLDQLA